MLILNFNDILLQTKKDPLLPLNYLLKLLNHNKKYDIQIQNPLISLKCYCPLPSLFILKNINNNKLINNNNEYHLYGTSNISVIYSNIHLPYKQKHMPIPFSFPIYHKNKLEIVISNVYYYEIKIKDTLDITNNWDEDSITIGYSSCNRLINTHIGACSDSIGYNSNTGCLDINNNKHYTKNISRRWVVGDIIGAGIIFISSTKIKPFFTFNGTMVYLHNDILDITRAYQPIISYKYSHSININLSTSKFKFNIKNIISKYSNNIISTNNNFFNNTTNNFFFNNTTNNNP